MASSAGDLATRVVAALVLAPLVVGVIYLGGWAYAALLVLAAALALHEWLALVGAPRGLAYPTAVVLVVVALALAALHAPGPALLAALVGAMALGAAARMIGHRHYVLEGSGVLYVGVPLIALWWLREPADAGFAVVLWLFLVVWATDIGGYFAGKGIGGPKLAPRISPKKTWAGLGGAMAAAAATAAVAGLAFGHAAGRLAVLGAILAVVAQLGDLFESAIKRRFQVKDSGTLIPGHGGILDRIDGLLAAAPALAATIALSGGSGAP